MRGASLEPLPSVLLPRQLLCPLKRRPRVSLNHHTADADVGDAGRNFDVSVIEIPLDLRMKVLPIPYINPYVMVGPMVALLQGEGDFGDATRRWALSGNVGGGLSFAFGSVKIQPEMRYQFGLTDYISDGFTIGNETIDPVDQPQISALSVRLSLMF